MVLPNGRTELEDCNIYLSSSCPIAVLLPAKTKRRKGEHATQGGLKVRFRFCFCPQFSLKCFRSSECAVIFLGVRFHLWSPIPAWPA